MRSKVLISAEGRSSDFNMSSVKRLWDIHIGTYSTESRA